MKTLYLECNMGAAGDMLMAALLELLDEPEDFVNQINQIGMDNVRLKREKVTKDGIVGTRMDVFHQGVKVDETKDGVYRRHQENESSESVDVKNVIQNLTVSDEVKKDASAIYQRLVEAESHVHGRLVTMVHFHEVGAWDAIVDAVCVSLLMEQIKPEKVIVSPVHVGRGLVRHAHGFLPVPAPATAHILLGVPIYQGNVEGELCTPTGAAILRRFADEFGPMPSMRVERIGYGMGKKDLEMASCVRAFLGEWNGGGSHIYSEMNRLR